MFPRWHGNLLPHQVRSLHGEINLLEQIPGETTVKGENRMRWFWPLGHDEYPAPREGWWEGTVAFQAPICVRSGHWDF